MKTNILSLTFRKVDCPKSPSYLVGELRIDGQLLGDRYVLDVRRLAEALAIARDIGDKRGEGADLGNLGRAYAALGEIDKATQYFERRLTIAREIGDKRGEAIAGWNLGLVYEVGGDLKRAVDQMQISVDFERQMGHKDAEKYADYLKNVRARLEKK